MTQAYVDYDPMTGQIRKISWKKLIGETVPISRQLAEDFMHGKEKFIDWRVDIFEELPVLFKKADPMPARQFSQLINLERDKSSVLICSSDTIEFESKYAKDAVVLYMTLKNDPSWLIKTIPVNTLMKIDNKYFLAVPAADTYSYFLGPNI
jgi:hypothetical protein